MRPETVPCTLFACALLLNHLQLRRQSRRINGCDKIIETSGWECIDWIQSPIRLSEMQQEEQLAIHFCFDNPKIVRPLPTKKDD